MTAVYRCAKCLETITLVSTGLFHDQDLDHVSTVRIWFVDHNTYTGTYIRREVSKGEPTYWTLHLGDAERWCVAGPTALIKMYVSNA
jgi:hypothetical protein